jgi:hypothetical protein
MQMSLLDVSDNKLKELPESIGGCKFLEELQANGKFIILNSPSYPFHCTCACTHDCFTVAPQTFLAL